MSIGLVGTKCGMTRIFTETGESIPVTVVQVQPNRITQIKTIETDGYNAIQVTAGIKKQSKVSKPEAGKLAKAGVEPGSSFKEFRLSEEEISHYKTGQQMTVEIFQVDQKVDVRSKTIGKGFAGAIKAHNFSAQRATHGNSLSHRAPGSIGQCQTPGRVMKGKRMAKHLGNVYRTIQSQKIVRVDIEKGLLLIKGVISGSKGAEVIVTPAMKERK
ncbi:MAG: 50S ribosomal protein L3 [Gammaproteobacteria bacterium RIFCSPHIGHO2_12_FULL_41_15]|nr:MAG: 50S ribosomal protein L3 [Gammaproteobacteria bacterium RIFCSPHIGHO2_12_FULL_41_15]